MNSSLKWYYANKAKAALANFRWRNKNKQRRAIYQHEYHLLNKDSRKEAKRAKDSAYYNKNKHLINERARIRRRKNPQPCRDKCRAYYRLHVKEANSYCRRRRREDRQYAMRANLRSRMWYALIGKSKCDSMWRLLGCDRDTLIAHLQSKFKKGMNWENYGKWHVDHIKPCRSFDLLNQDQQRICFHFTNLQPLWASDNISKGAST